MANAVRRAAGRARRWWRAHVPQTSERGTTRLQARLDELAARVGELEEAVQECRNLNVRLAEITDLIQELLVPIAMRDQNKVGELLAHYRDSI